MTEYKEKGSQSTISNWQGRDIEAMLESLELPNWAPWLAASHESLQGRAKVFPKGQFLVKNVEGNPLASLSMNKIFWSGNTNILPSWDEVAGDPTTYEQTYLPQGNTLIMMSMNVHPHHQGEGYAKRLIEQAKLLAIGLNIDYLIGSFRPNEFGKFKLENLDKPTSFDTYCTLKRADGLPIDGWLRNLTRNGMQPLKVDSQAMTVTVPLEEFEEYKQTFNTDSWKETKAFRWECGEVGDWTIDYANHSATYKESNLWGLIWKKNGLK